MQPNFKCFLLFHKHVLPPQKKQGGAVPEREKKTMFKWGLVLKGKSKDLLLYILQTSIMKMYNFHNQKKQPNYIEILERWPKDGHENQLLDTLTLMIAGELPVELFNIL